MKQTDWMRHNENNLSQAPSSDVIQMKSFSMDEPIYLTQTPFTFFSLVGLLLFWEIFQQTRS